MLYIWAIFFPPAVFFESGKPGLGVANLCVWITCCGAPFASGWAFFEANQFLNDKRNEDLIDAITRSGRKRK